jgi:HK97 family phage prohead protease
MSNLSITSFSYSNGEVPADLVLDARSIDHDTISGLWELDGNDERVSSKVLATEQARGLISEFENSLGKVSSVSVGCNQGRHRSVSVANELKRLAEASGIEVTISHRDLGKLRSSSMTIETRSFEARADLEERTIVGLAVPYGQTADIGGMYQERFAPGAIGSVEDVKLFYGHEEPIGKVVEGRDTEQGYEIVAKVSDTVRGNEVLTLMRDGVLNKFSVGFIPVESEKDGSTITRTKVSLKEVSVVPFPAFAGANITEVREEQATADLEPENEQEKRTMSENMELEVRSVIDEVAELRRVVEAGQLSSTPAVIGAEIRSQGEFAKKLLKGDADAVELARAASTSADTVALPGFIGYIDNLIDNNRPALSVFSRGALPNAGLTVEYAQVTANDIAVGVQDPEGEALSFGNLTIDSVSAPVKTYGGYTSFTKQTIERSTVDYLNTVFRALSLAYANATNAALVAHVQGLSYTGKVFDASALTSAALIGAITDGSTYIFENTGLRPEAIVASPEAYKKLMTIVGEDGRPVVLVNGAGVNNIGSANIPGLAGQLFGLPVVVDPAMTANKVYMANSAAIQTFESAGAPVRLTDSEITTLTDSVSVYGYMAITTPFAGAIVEIDVVA